MRSEDHYATNDNERSRRLNTMRGQSYNERSKSIITQYKVQG